MPYPLIILIAASDFKVLIAIYITQDYPIFHDFVIFPASTRHPGLPTLLMRMAPSLPLDLVVGLIAVSIL